MADVQELARQAGYKDPRAVGECEDFAYFDLERFAELVRADIIAKLPECCTCVAETNIVRGRDKPHHPWCPRAIAAAIRAGDGKP